jgi:hypothetical protein
MTKIVLKWEASSVFGVFKTPRSVLQHPAVVAFQKSRSAICVADPYADLAVTGFAEAGVPIEVVKF